MKEVWTITKEDAAKMCEFLLRELDNYIKAGMLDEETVEAISAVHAALSWADRIEIEG